MTIIATLCYVMDESAGKTLMIHRTKKANDDHEGKFNGLGGKCEENEDPYTCCVREIYEESGLHIKPEYRGNITFTGFGKKRETWEVHLFVATEYSGDLIESPEGELVWVDTKDILTLNLWASDSLFLPDILERKIILARCDYEGDTQIRSEKHVVGSV